MNARARIGESPLRAFPYSALVRGQFGGTGQGSALTYELGRVVHGSSTAFKHRSI